MGQESKKAYFAYSLPAFVLAFAGLPLYVLAPDFYATQMGVPLGLLGGLLLAVRAFDALQDPFIGYISDRFAHKRRFFFLGAFAVFAIGMLVLYIPVKPYAVYAFGIGIVLSATAFSIISINLNAIGSLMTQNTHAKTHVTAWREGLGLCGILLASILPFVLGHFLAPRAAFAAYALIFSLCVFIAAFFFLPWLANRPTLQALDTHRQKAIAPVDFSFLRDVHLRFFFLAYAVSVLASALPAVLVIFFIRDVLEAENLTGLFLLLYFLSAMAFIPVWRALSARIGKVQSWVTAIILAVGAFVGAGFLSAGDATLYAVICVLSGAALGAELILPPSILSDLIDERAAADTTSMQFSVLAFLMKAALAVAAGISFTLLDYSGFRAGSANSDVALCMLAMLYAFIPCGLKLLSAAMLWGWAQWTQKGKVENEKTNRMHSNGGHYGTGRM